jgi:hypothetical protein
MRPLAVGSRMTLRNRGQPAGFARIAAPILTRAMRGAMIKDLQRLSGILQRPVVSPRAPSRE